MARVDPGPGCVPEVALVTPEMRDALLEVMRAIEAKHGGEIDADEAWRRIDRAVDRLPSEMWAEVVG